MASLSFIRYLINCDGCKAVYGDRDGFESLTEARATAYAKGWRFPNRMTSTGTQAVATSDVCPACLFNWKPQVAGKIANRQRVLVKSEVASLPLPSDRN